MKLLSVNLECILFFYICKEIYGNLLLIAIALAELEFCLMRGVRMRVIAFGAGEYGKLYCRYPDIEVTIVAVADNSEELIGKRLFEYDIISPADILLQKYDKVIITIENVNAAKSVEKQLNEMGISNVEVYDSIPVMSPKVQALYRVSEIIESRSILGSIAECGVYRGWTATYLNSYYPSRNLFLFDTFNGFDKKDTYLESEESIEWLSKRGNEYSIPIQSHYVLSKCKYPWNVTIQQGYVPDTFAGLENEMFAFVHLDMDLYKPQLSALRFFADRMSKGGMIFLHDYYRPDLPGTRKAVHEFSYEREFFLIPSAGSSHVALVLCNG